jgi:single-stranded-DNA-specific exonuclease
MRKRWMLKQSGVNIRKLAYNSGVSEVIAGILANRDIKEPEEIKKFLRSSLGDLQDGALMKDMEKGVSILKQAIINKNNIVVYGDYDADGVISTYILYSALKYCGAQVSYYIPDRESEGYGMHSDRVAALKQEGCEVILTCDNGIAAFEQIELAKSLGMQVVVTDHHDVPFLDSSGEERQFVIPPADAVINPKQQECGYPFKLLCGGSIAFKFVQALYKEMGLDENIALGYIEYAAISTICDVVDLVGENRIIAKNGLRMLNNTNNIGLKALIKETGLEGKKISGYHVGFIIGPCINATGRLESAKLSVELLLSNDEKEAETLAKKLHSLNIERQELTNSSVDEIIQYIEKNNMSKDKVLVVFNSNVHESIAGIVAGRIRERYNVPTIILTEGKEMPKGSGRSIEGYNMFEELIKCKELLHKFGGHPMAAGLSLRADNIPLLREKLIGICPLSEEDLIPIIRIDKQIPLGQVNFKLIEEISLLEPFGKGNPSPLFADKAVEIYKISFLGKEKNVLKMMCRIKGTFNKIDAISFEHSEEFKDLIAENYGEETLYGLIEGSGETVILDIIFYPDVNIYKGNASLQLIVKEIRCVARK